jgi:hypothetical protein
MRPRKTIVTPSKLPPKMWERLSSSPVEDGERMVIEPPLDGTEDQETPVEKKSLLKELGMEIWGYIWPPLYRVCNALWSLFAFLIRLPLHPAAGVAILRYFQLFILLGIVSGVCYGCFQLVSVVTADVRTKANHEMGKILSKMEECEREFIRNRCDMNDLPPALEVLCAEWERCMLQDPHNFSLLPLSARVLGEVVNSFVEPLSIKSMVFALGIILVIVSLFIQLFRLVARLSSYSVPSGVQQQQPEARERIGHYGSPSSQRRIGGISPLSEETAWVPVGSSSSPSVTWKRKDD